MPRRTWPAGGNGGLYPAAGRGVLQQRASVQRNRIDERTHRLRRGPRRTQSVAAIEQLVERAHVDRKRLAETERVTVAANEERRAVRLALGLEHLVRQVQGRTEPTPGRVGVSVWPQGRHNRFV